VAWRPERKGKIEQRRLPQGRPVGRAAFFMQLFAALRYLTAAFFNVTIAVWLSLVAMTTRTGAFSELMEP